MFPWHRDRPYRHEVRRDDILRIVLGFAAILSGCLVLAIVVFLLREAWPILASGEISKLLTDQKWQPDSESSPGFGIAPLLAGSLLVTTLASAIALPLGVGHALFEVYFAPPALARWQNRFVELLAGVPSVIFGFWGLSVIVPLVNRIEPPGQSLLAAGLVLSLMIIPTVALTARGAFRSLDPALLLSAAALGLSRPTTLFSIVLPAARSGLFTGATLAVARAVGETLAVVMVCGNIAQIPGSIFDPVRPITATIALEMGYATAAHRALLYTTGLCLVVLTGILVAWPALRSRKANRERRVPLV